jgi:hypothetical protein
MSEHTKGRLELDSHGLHAFSGRRLVAGCGGHQDNFTPDLLEQNKANARRLVACWNACESIDTAKLESRDVTLMSGDAQRKRDSKLERQRDEAVALLRDATNQIAYLHGKFQETGSGNCIIQRCISFLATLDRTEKT